MSNAPWYIGSNGATSAVKHEAQKFARELVEDTNYRDNLRKALKDRTCPPAIEALIWHYAYGKPVEHVNVSVQTEDLSQLSTDELMSRYEKKLEELKEVSLLEDSIPAEFKTA